MSRFENDWRHSEADLQVERDTIRKEVNDLRAHADHLEKNLEKIARARARAGYSKKLK